MARSVEARSAVLASFGAGPAERDELLRYNENHFDRSHLPSPLVFPLPAEPFVEAWQSYAERARAGGLFPVLREALVQLRFPIEAGISAGEAYRAATLRGTDTDGAAGPPMSRPDELRLVIHPSLAGPIPMLIPAGRADFAVLVQALTRRNEPWPVPGSMGACMVGGYNNWDRVRRYRRAWEAAAASPSEAAWQEEFRRLIPQKEHYQDRFIIISDGPYSDVAAEDMALPEEDWRRLSLAIRIEHESVHYFTRRALGSTRNNTLDELIADYSGIVAATGHFRADWFLRFSGLESYPIFREGGRLQNYLGDPPLSGPAFRVLQSLVTAAAENVERFDRERGPALRSDQGRALMLLALAHQTLEDLASADALSLLCEALDSLKESAGHVPS
jgi:hypothetical protein